MTNKKFDGGSGAVTWPHTDYIPLLLKMTKMAAGSEEKEGMKVTG